MSTIQSTGFRIKRPLAAISGFTTGLDPTVKRLLDELNEILGRKAFLPKDLKERLTLVLEPKYAPKVDDEDWAPGSLVASLNKTGKGLAGGIVASAVKQRSAGQVEIDTSEPLTLEECIDRTPELAKMKYAFAASRPQFWPTLDYNTRAVLDGYPNIADYLVAYAFVVMGLKDLAALTHFVLRKGGGARGVVNYAVISAARALIDREQLNVADYNRNDGALARELAKGGVPLSAGGFEAATRARIKELVFHADEIELIETATDLNIPADLKPLLVQYMQRSRDLYTKKNIGFYLPVLVSEALKARGQFEPEDGGPAAVEESEFRVQFHDEGGDVVSDVSRSAVRCAAQLYHAMVVGDELDVFGAVNFFTHKELIGSGFELRDKRLQAHLRMYVFDNKFVDLETNTVMERTRPAERQMFYRQVFNQGAAEVTEDVVLNAEFSRLFKVLILESAKYLQRAQQSFYPDNFVSRQNVMQAVEDLQYNLSSYCTGMVNVIAPMIDAEINFVLTKIFKHPEVVAHVVPGGGSWQRVVERLAGKMKRARPRATTLYNKARLGESILRSIADYTPASFEEDETFSAFISQVDAFITTQSILQESVTKDLQDADAGDDRHTLVLDEEDEPAAFPGVPPRYGLAAAPAAGAGAGVAAAGPGAGAADEWDF